MQLPDEVRGLYFTSRTANSQRAWQLLDYMKESGINAVVIDVKLDDGTLDFPSKKIIKGLAEAGIYKIARVAVMRDATIAEAHPELALRTASGEWRDNIGSLWLDPASPKVADLAIEVGKEVYEHGFDEVQFDYVRFPSDGNISAIVYPFHDPDKASRIEVMQKFFKRVGGAMQEEGIPVSFDLFGMTMWSDFDFNIGQRLQDALPYADFISPMVYPSHFPDGFEGYANPALYPYEIVKRSLDEGAKMIGELRGAEGSLGDQDLRKKFRPWLQDFDIGAVYTSDLIEAQIKAVRDGGGSGWILWNARNVYEPADYLGN
ncbi:MAG: putative glycoside hydrolase [Patescibacteria group bacterium]